MIKNGLAFYTGPALPPRTDSSLLGPMRQNINLIFTKLDRAVQTIIANAKSCWTWSMIFDAILEKF